MSIDTEILIWLEKRMLAKLKLRLDSQAISFKKSSNLQGVLFEHIDHDYADELHQQRVHPYSQHLTIENGEPVWSVNVLDDKAYDKIIGPLLDSGFDSFTLKDESKDKINIISKVLFTDSRTELLKRFNDNKAEHQISIHFKTPTAFKQNGLYYILPDLRLIYQSLMMRYTDTSQHVDMTDEDMINDMLSNSFISKHDIKSRGCPMQGTVIPGFIGRVTIGIKRNETIARYIRMLFEFGEFSGIGIKTSMGMGAMKIGD